MTQGLPSADDADSARAQTVHERASRSLEVGDSSGWHRLSREFHLALIAPSKMLRLLALMESTWNITEPAQPMTLLPADVLHQLNADHDALLAPYRARDVEAAQSAAARHIENLLDALRALAPDVWPFAAETR